jgi:hypothetical protein
MQLKLICFEYYPNRSEVWLASTHNTEDLFFSADGKLDLLRSALFLQLSAFLVGRWHFRDTLNIYQSTRYTFSSAFASQEIMHKSREHPMFGRAFVRRKALARLSARSHFTHVSTQERTQIKNKNHGLTIEYPNQLPS